MILWGVDSSRDWAIFPCLLRMLRCRTCRSHPTRQHKSFEREKEREALLGCLCEYFFPAVHSFQWVEAFLAASFPAHMSCAGTTSSDVDIVCRQRLGGCAVTYINCPSRRCVVGEWPKNFGRIYLPPFSPSRPISDVVAPS